jgi:hypothetical protein
MEVGGGLKAGERSVLQILAAGIELKWRLWVTLRSLIVGFPK